MYHNTIWESIEATAWSLDFNYADYLSMRLRCNAKSAPLDEQGYKDLCQMMSEHMHRHYTKT